MLRLKRGAARATSRSCAVSRRRSGRRRGRPSVRRSARPASRRCGRPCGFFALGGAARRCPSVSSAASRSSLSALRPALLELDLRVGMAVRLVRRALAAAAGADLLAFPARLGERASPSSKRRACVARSALPRRRSAMRLTTVSTPGTPRAISTACSRLVLGRSPSRPARSISSPMRADVDGALAEDRIVAERLEHALLEPFVVTPSSSSSSSSSSYSSKSSATSARDARPRPRSARRRTRRRAAEPTDALRDEHADGEAGDGAEQHARDVP